MNMGALTLQLVCSAAVRLRERCPPPPSSLAIYGERVGPRVMKVRELALLFTGCNTLENRSYTPYTYPWQQNRACPKGMGMDMDELPHPSGVGMGMFVD